MGALSATTVSVSPPFPKLKVSLALVAPIHRKARISTRDLLREVEDDSMESRVEDDVKRSIFSMHSVTHSCLCCSVVAMETKQYVVGDVITMRLMRREKGALVAMPSSQWVKVEEPVRFGAFDDEVAEPTKDTDAELPGTPDPILESVLEESPEAISDPPLEPQPEEDTPPNQADSARPSATVVHGPYYYFYQGVTFSFPTCSDQQYACREMIVFVIAPVICGPQNGNE
ncbi:hypothetical protein GOODEAATRI_021241 [Goodea atripinnis]|uniref:Uncharacterized protein n=1 Tax=Goodea atripinnis TaxID=208336 RepID=A0ABV0PFU8_9TELE